MEEVLPFLCSDSKNKLLSIIQNIPIRKLDVNEILMKFQKDDQYSYQKIRQAFQSISNFHNLLTGFALTGAELNGKIQISKAATVQWL